MTYCSVGNTVEKNWLSKPGQIGGRTWPNRRKGFFGRLWQHLWRKFSFQGEFWKVHAPLIPNMCRTVQSIFFTVLASNVKFALLGVPVASELVRLTTRRGDFKIYWSLNMPSSPSSIGFNYSHKLTITAAYNSATAVTAQQCLGNKWLVHF